MLDQSVVNILIGVAFGALGWFARTLWDGQKELRVDLTKLQVVIANDYISREVMRDILSEVKGDLTYIRDRVDSIVHNKRSSDE